MKMLPAEIVTPLILSGGVWIILGLYFSVRMQIFIVKRYEKETGLLNTVFFEEHATFTRYLPGFLSSAMYASHLLMVLWGWSIYKSKKAYRDIKDPSAVTLHFTAKEVRIVKWFGICSFLALSHAVALFIFKFIWPESFS